MSTQKFKSQDEYMDGDSTNFLFSRMALQVGYTEEINLRIFIDEDSKEITIDEETKLVQNDEIDDFEMHIEDSQIATREYFISNMTDNDEFITKYKKIFDTQKANTLKARYEIKELVNLEIILDCIDYYNNTYRNKEN